MMDENIVSEACVTLINHISSLYIEKRNECKKLQAKMQKLLPLITDSYKISQYKLHLLETEHYVESRSDSEEMEQLRSEVRELRSEVRELSYQLSKGDAERCGTCDLTKAQVDKLRSEVQKLRNRLDDVCVSDVHISSIEQIVEKSKDGIDTPPSTVIPTQQSVSQTMSDIEKTEAIKYHDKVLKYSDICNRKPSTVIPTQQSVSQTMSDIEKDRIRQNNKNYYDPDMVDPPGCIDLNRKCISRDHESRCRRNKQAIPNC